MPAQPILLAQADFKIPAPRSSTTQTPPSAPSPAPAPAPAQPAGGTWTTQVNLPKSIPTGDMAVSGAIFLALLVPFFFAKVSVTRSLQSRYAAPGPASEAGWMLFVWLAFTTLCLIAATVANLWTQAVIVGPATLVWLVLLILFMRKRSLALKTRR